MEFPIRTAPSLSGEDGLKESPPAVYEQKLEAGRDQEADGAMLTLPMIVIVMLLRVFIVETFLLLGMTFSIVRSFSQESLCPRDYRFS